MKKVFLLSAFMMLPFLASAQAVELPAVEQNVEQQALGQQYYMYNVVTFPGSMNNGGFGVEIDDGKSIKTLKGKDGKKIKFRTPAAALMYNSQAINLEMLKAYYITGLPMDLIHAAGTVVFILLAAEQMLEKLDRIKVKYGLVE